MSYFRFSVIAVVFLFLLLFLNPAFSFSQDVPADTEIQQALEEEDQADAVGTYKITVGVSEVRLDVVVVDGKGRQITDLTAADFEVRQNKLPQTVTSSIYINNQTDAAASPSPSASTKDAKNLLKSSVKTPALKEEEVRRTIVFIVDNLSMQFKHLSFAKMSMKRFLDNQMQSGDMVAIIRTSSGNSALQTFLSDKRQIYARIDGIPAAGPVLSEGQQRPDDGQLHRIYENQLSTLSCSLRALKDMPGRKILLFVSAHPKLYTPPPTVMGALGVNFYEYYGSRFERLANDALRSGVVVHSMNANGLCGGDKDPGDWCYPDDLMDAINPLPAKTGGTYIEENNFFVDGIGKEVNNLIAGYYLVSYIPPETTFKASRRDVFHRVEVKVKRKGATVYARDGFYGRLENEMDDDAPPPHPLSNAVLSPFQYSDLNVNMAAGYVRDANVGYLVRSWIHVDPQNIEFTETEDGGARIDIDTVCMTSDINGAIADFRHAQYTFNFGAENKAENIAWIQKHGIRFSMLLPVKNPGSYTVRAAVHDMKSGKVGSVYQFVEIPDLKNKGLALTDIFMITSVEDINWIGSDATKELDEGVFFPVMNNTETRTPALRSYMPGDNLQTLTILYNADANAIARSEIETVTILYKDGKELLRGDPRPINPANVTDPNNIPILQRLTLGADMEPGDYTLQLLITDKKNSEKRDNEGGLNNPKEGLLSRIARVYTGTVADPYKTDKGVASQTLNFKVEGR